MVRRSTKTSQVWSHDTEIIFYQNNKTHLHLIHSRRRHSWLHTASRTASNFTSSPSCGALLTQLQTDLIRNSITDSDDTTQKEADERLALAESVINGDTEKIKLIIKKKPDLLFAQVARDSSSDSLNLFELAVTHRQCHVVETLLREAERSNNNKNLETFLCKSDPLTGSQLINEVIKYNPKIGAKLLNNCINLNSDERLVNINLSSVLGTNIPQTILENGSRDLLSHPVSLTATQLQWTKYRHYVFIALVLNLLTTLSVSAAVTVQSNTNTTTALVILSCLLYTPILSVKCWLVLNSSRTLISYFKTFLEALHLLFFLVFVIVSLSLLESSVLQHIQAWTVLLTWLRLLAEIHDIPHTSFYLQIFINVFIDIIKFVLLLIALLVGLSLSFYSLMKQNSREVPSLSPVDQFITVLGIMAGEFNIPSNFHQAQISLQGSTQIIFLLTFLLVSLVLMNITVGLTITSLQETFLTREQLKLVRMMITNYKIEKILRKIRKLKRRINLSKYRFFINLLEPLSVKEIFLKTDDEKKEKTQTLLALMSGTSRTSSSQVYIKNNVTEEVEPTKYLLNQEILEKCQSILEARRIRMEEELAAEASKCEGVYLSV